MFKLIKENFENAQDKNPGWGSYICLCSAIKGRNYAKSMLRKAFNKLVDKNDYDVSEKEEYVKYLLTI